MKGSYRTTALGLTAALISVLSAAYYMLDGDPNTNPDWTATVAAVSSGLGLLFARDNKVTSEEVNAGAN